MENKNLLKGLHAALAIIALFVFLAAPFISYGGKYEISGADLLERMDGDNGWFVLFIIAPWSKDPIFGRTGGSGPEPGRTTNWSRARNTTCTAK